MSKKKNSDNKDKLKGTGKEPIKELSNSIKDGISRLAYYVLFSELEYVLLPHVMEFFPNEMTTLEVKELLLELEGPKGKQEGSDYEFRFIDQGGDELLVGLKNISENYRNLLKDVEGWKSAMCEVLKKLEDRIIEFKSFESIVPRPDSIPKSVVLKDVLDCDISRRFSWYGPYDRICIQGPLQDEVRRQMIKQKIGDALSRARLFILFTRKDFVRLEIILHCFPTIFLWREICESIENDPLKRFKVISRNVGSRKKEYFVGLASTIETDQILLDDVDEWRKAMVQQLNQSPTKQLPLSILARDRPEHIFEDKTIRKQTKIFDVLRSDSEHRFITSGLAINLLVNLSPTLRPEKEKFLTRCWLQEIELYLREKRRSKLLLDLERDVRRPFGYNGSLQVALTQSNAVDKFTVISSSRGLLMATITPQSEEFNQMQMAAWRNEICKYIIARGTDVQLLSSSPQSSPSRKSPSSSNLSRFKCNYSRSCKVSDVVRHVREPWPMVWNGSVVSFLEDDPKKRFLLDNETIPGIYLVHLNIDALNGTEDFQSSGLTTNKVDVNIKPEKTARRNIRDADHRTVTNEGECTEHVTLQSMYSSQFEIIKAEVLPDNYDGDYENLWCVKIFNYIFSCKRPVLPSDITKYIPRPDGLDPNLDMLSILKSDPKRRFAFSKTSKGCPVVSLRISEEDKGRICDEWRSAIFDYLKAQVEKSGNGVLMSKIGKVVPRPWLLARPLTMQDVLRDDPLGRFKLEGTGDDVKIYIPENNFTPATNLMQSNSACCGKNEKGIPVTVQTGGVDALEQVCEDWCDRAAIFLAWQRRAIFREELGDIGVPLELLNTDLVQHLVNDSKKRFVVSVNSRGMQEINFQITSEEKAGLMHDWAIDVLNHVLRESRKHPKVTIEIAKIATLLPRPWLLPPSCTLNDLLRTHPSICFCVSTSSGGVSLNYEKAPKSIQEVGVRVEDSILRRTIGFSFSDYVSSGVSDKNKSFKDPHDVWRSKIFKYFLWHHQTECPLSVLIDDVQSDMKAQKLQKILENDPLQRFKCNTMTMLRSTCRKTSAIIVVSLCISPTKLNVIKHRWLEMITNHLEYRTRLNPGFTTTVGGICEIIPSLWFFPLSPDFVSDALRNDSRNRFQVNGKCAGVNNMRQITVGLTSQHVQSAALLSNAQSSITQIGFVSNPYFEEWRIQILKFLHDRKKSLTVNDIEVNIPRPVQVPGDISMLSVIKNDPKDRFLIQKNARSVKLVTPNISQSDTLMLLEEWKFDVMKCMVTRTSSPKSISGRKSPPNWSANSLLKIAPRPWLIPRQYTLLNVLQSDPLKRFQFEGNDVYSSIILTCPAKVREHIASMSFNEYYMDLENKNRVPLSFLSAPSTASRSLSKLNENIEENSDTFLKKSESCKECDTTNGNEDMALESYIQSTLNYIRKIKRGVTQNELDREIERPKYVLNSFHTLLSDEKKRFVEARNSRHIRVIILPVTKEESEQLAEEWMCDIYEYVERYGEDGTAAYTIARDVIRPWLLPRPLSLVSFLKSDKLRRFSVAGGDKNAIVCVAHHVLPTLDEKLSRMNEMQPNIIRDNVKFSETIEDMDNIATAESEELDSGDSSTNDDDVNDNKEVSGSKQSTNFEEVADTAPVIAYIQTVGSYLKKCKRPVDQNELDKECKPPVLISNSFQFLSSSTFASGQFNIVDKQVSLRMSDDEEEQIIEEWKCNVSEFVKDMHERDPWCIVTVRIILEKVVPPCQLTDFDAESTIRNDTKRRFDISGEGEAARVYLLNNVNSLEENDVENSGDCNRHSHHEEDEMQFSHIFEAEWGSMNKFQGGERGNMRLFEFTENLQSLDVDFKKEINNEKEEMFLEDFNVSDLVSVPQAPQGLSSTSISEFPKVSFLEYLSKQQQGRDVEVDQNFTPLETTSSSIGVLSSRSFDDGIGQMPFHDKPPGFDSFSISSSLIENDVSIAGPFQGMFTSHKSPTLEVDSHSTINTAMGGHAPPPNRWLPNLQITVSSDSKSTNASAEDFCSLPTPPGLQSLSDDIENSSSAYCSLSPPDNTLMSSATDIMATPPQSPRTFLSNNKASPGNNKHSLTPPGLLASAGDDENSRNYFVAGGIVTETIVTVPPSSILTKTVAPTGPLTIEMSWADVISGEKEKSQQPIKSRMNNICDTSNAHEIKPFSCSTPVHDWLKQVFGDSYSFDFISEMNSKFEEEGIVLCRDLLLADSQNMLGLDLMDSFGYSLEHLERILTSLDLIKDDES